MQVLYSSQVGIIMFETNKNILGKKFKEYRKHKNLTQFELAEFVGLNEKQISRIEAGLNYPTYMTFVKLIEALDIDLADFIAKPQISINPTVKEINRILKSANDFELKIYLDVLKALNKNLKMK